MDSNSSSRGKDRSRDRVWRSFLNALNSNGRSSQFDRFPGSTPTRQGKSALGPYAFEEQMPTWLRNQLEEGEHAVSNETCDTLPVLRALYELDQGVEQAFLCHSGVKFVDVKRGEDIFYGYKNIQILISYIIAAHSQGFEHFQGTLPTILRLQDLIEEAWDKGVYSSGRIETGGLRGTRKYIGTPEALALFIGLDIPCEVGVFNEADGNITCDQLLQSVEDYFAAGHRGLPRRVQTTDLPPLFLQHLEYSLTIFGFERRKDGTRNLLAFNPAPKPSSLIRNLFRRGESKHYRPRDPLSPYRKGESYLRKFTDFDLLRLIPETSPPASGIEQGAGLDIFVELCDLCQQMNPPRDGEIYTYHPGYSQLLVSSRHCRLCNMFVKVLDDVGHGERLLEESRQGGQHMRPELSIQVLRPAVCTIDGPPLPLVDVILRNQNLNQPRFREGYAFSPLELRCFGFFRDGVTYNASLIWFLKDEVSDNPLWTCSDAVNSEASLPLVQQWFRDCTLNHPNCSLASDNECPQLPTRVIDVGPPDGQQEPRLLISSGMRSTYTTLSHCWGSKPMFMTTSSSLSAHMQCIPMAGLPKTFKDAVVITRKLRIQYLWIDSLCIIQDDQEDWEREAAKMASVYHNSEVTIAATTANDSGGGCFVPQEPAYPIEFTNVYCSTSGLPPISTTQIGLFRPKPCEFASLRQAPLNKRGWVLQESVLSRRTIHFAKDQLYWHCLTRVASADGILDAPADSTRYSSREQLASPGVVLLRPDVSAETLYNSWWDLIEDYSARGLSYQKDKFAALAGLTTFFREKIDDEPFAGLWRNDLHFGLLWSSCCRSQSTQSTLGAIPSWSWASVEAAVRAPSIRGRGAQFSRIENKLEILSATISWSALEFTSSISQCQLRVKGLLKEVTILPLEPNIAGTNWLHLNPMFDNDGINEARFIIRPYPMRPLGAGEPGIGICSLDRDPPASSQVLRCLEVLEEESSWHGFVPGLTTRWYHVLIVEPIAAASHEFRRLGAGYIYADRDGFNELKPETICLV